MMLDSAERVRPDAGTFVLDLLTVAPCRPSAGTEDGAGGEWPHCTVRDPCRAAGEPATRGTVIFDDPPCVPPAGGRMW